MEPLECVYEDIPVLVKKLLDRKTRQSTCGASFLPYFVSERGKCTEILQPRLPLESSRGNCWANQNSPHDSIQNVASPQTAMTAIPCTTRASFLGCAPAGDWTGNHSDTKSVSWPLSNNACCWLRVFFVPKITVWHYICFTAGRSYKNKRELAYRVYLGILPVINSFCEAQINPTLLVTTQSEINRCVFVLPSNKSILRQEMFSIHWD